jgi:hypothetical protein
MACDGHMDRPIFVTKNGSQINQEDWKKMKRLAFDDLPESVRAPQIPTASDAEHQLAQFRGYLRGKGVDAESCDEACEIARRDLAGEVTDDELPTSGPGGARNLANSQSREPDEKVFRSPGRFESRPPLGTTASGEKRSPVGESDYRSSPASDSASFLREFPDAARIGHTFGVGQFDQPLPLSKRERRQAYDGADGKAREHLEDLLGFKLPEVGPWPKRG